MRRSFYIVAFRGDTMFRNDGKVARLARVHLFQGYSKRELWKVASAVDEMAVRPGRVLSRQGEPARTCMVFAEGSATVETDGIESGRVAPGEWLGHTALRDRLPVASTVTSRSDALIYMLYRDGFRMLNDEIPAFARGLLRSVHV